VIPDGPEAPSTDFCWSCSRDEPIPEGGAYQICGECNHVYGTEQDLVDAHNQIITEMNQRMRPGQSKFGLWTTAEDIYFCHHCLHDF
jgi:hypothetical protein